jgi:hypothetical protein
MGVKSQRWWLPLGITVLTVAGCMVAPGTAVETSPEVSVMTVGAPLRDPVYSYRDDALVGITEDGRVAEISNLLRSNATTRFSPPMAAGRNLQISQKDDGHVFVPQPQRGKVAVLDLTTLRQVDDFNAGPAPAYLSEDAGMRILLALSADGASVTPVDEYGFRKFATAEIPGDPSNTIDGANRGRDIDYHVYGPAGIRFYRGPSSPPEELGWMDMDVAAAAGDGAAVTRSYVGRPNDDLIYCVDLKRVGKGLKVRAATQLPSPVRRIGTDDTRIYAATDRELVTLETVSFMRFEGDIIPVLRTTNYRASLPEAQRSAPLSGMAVGPHRIYLTFAGTPLVVSVAKAHL